MNKIEQKTRVEKKMKVEIDWGMLVEYVVAMLVMSILVYIIMMSIPILDCQHQIIDYSCTGWEIIFRGK